MIAVAKPPAPDDQAYLIAAIAELRAALEEYATGGQGPKSSTSPEDSGAALPRLVERFGLTTFERSVLLTCAAVELDSTFAELVARLQGGPERTAPTFAFALRAFADAHWSALSPSRPLRRWRLIDVHRESGVALPAAPLQVDERIAHALVGLNASDERCAAYIARLPRIQLVPSHMSLARRIGTVIAHADEDGPLVELCGADSSTRRELVAAAAAFADMGAIALDADRVHRASDPEMVLQLCVRETMLAPALLYVELEDPARRSLFEHAHAPLVVGTSRRMAPGVREVIRFDVARPTAQEQRVLWAATLGTRDPEATSIVDELASTFDLSRGQIAGAVLAAGADAALGSERRSALWSAVVASTRPRLDDLAERITAAADWSTLVLPTAVEEQLHALVSHVRHRRTVLDEWGFAAPSARGRGVAALFAGSSGTGKTTAAEVIARELGFELFRIDLAGVVNKYIGETEKNLRRVFEAAEAGGCVLFFDEADALFGRRSEVKDSHDRYANVEIDYLLQRLETFRGVAILATNLRSALDSAFLRRLRFTVTFPFPDRELRAQIWERAFPAGAPKEGLSSWELARWELSGGSIRNVALHAAFRAADRGAPICMADVREAARTEFIKLERPFTEAGA